MFFRTIKRLHRRYSAENSDFIRVIFVFMGKILVFGLLAQKRYFLRIELNSRKGDCEDVVSSNIQMNCDPNIPVHKMGGWLKFKADETVK